MDASWIHAVDMGYKSVKYIGNVWWAGGLDSVVLNLRNKNYINEPKNKIVNTTSNRVKTH